MTYSEKLKNYRAFLRAKAVATPDRGFRVEASEVNPMLKPHQVAIVLWAILGGCRAIFAKFGLGKTFMQLEAVRLTLLKAIAAGLQSTRDSHGRALITCPLGVRGEFMRDAAKLGITLTFIRRIEEAHAPGIYLTNFETVRDGKLDPGCFTVCSLDEASVLRGFGGSKTFREFMRLYESVPYRFVATAIPDPNDHIELLAYAAFLGIMDGTKMGVGMPEYLLHLCPMQFDIADRAIEQFTMPGETVFDPFGGVGTTPYRAQKLGRKGVMTELNHRYFLDAWHMSAGPCSPFDAFNERHEITPAEWKASNEARHA